MVQPSGPIPQQPMPQPSVEVMPGWMPQPMKEFPEGSGNMVVDDEAHELMYPCGDYGFETLLQVCVIRNLALGLSRRSFSYRVQ